MRFAVLMILVAAVTAFVLYEVERGKPEYRIAQNEEKRLKQQLAELRVQNDRLREEVKLMAEDVFAIEKHAREKFGYAASNEIIIRFDK